MNFGRDKSNVGAKTTVADGIANYSRVYRLIPLTFMPTFCPTCGNHLLIGVGEAGTNHFECRTCPYQFHIEQHLYNRKTMKQKEVDDVLGGAGAWDNVDSTKVQCPNKDCEGGDGRAYFFQLQIRSADEPMTSFYKCTSCGFQWREN